ncbi:hypothetical protein EDE05_12850 [Neorhizobium sp. R1-B]|uniref:hypothetical protein n=1 Tax=Neorhizobium sp. R1-B TaxID=2485162 RepID=UPI0010648031|nr:hypothetical protein [Neorhizobium sp. R1-B]TDX72629.1 hypothetical protein EDE05_12850 [Neorhizobium sp. R1-B]
MDAKQLHILQHSLGLDQYGRGTFYRNRFVTGEGSIDHPICMELVALGYMKRFQAVELFGGSDAFTVTEEGKRAAVAESPAPPKLSRSKQRYIDFLAYDGSMTFMEYIRWRDYRDRRSA